MASSITESSQRWTLIGPQPTYDGFSGRVTAIAINPLDPNTVYLGGAEGGVWKTTDGGARWKPLTDFQPALAIGSLAIDPSNPNVIYAGTGEANFNGDSYFGMGVLKSTDAGVTWTLLDSTDFEYLSIGSLAINPANTQVLLAAASFGGVFRSTDGGQTWTNVLQGLSTGVVISPKGDKAYAAMVSFGGASGIYQSADSGVTWTISNGSGANTIQVPTDAFRITLAMAPSAPGTLFAGLVVSTSTASPLAAFYKTTDGGATWTLIPGQGYCENQCWYNNVLAVSPVDPNRLIGGGVRLKESTDGGATWTAAAAAYVHVDQHAVAFTPDGSKVFIGNDGGVWSSATTGGPYGWTELNDTLALTQFYAGISIQPGNPAISLGGTQDNGTLTYSGIQWQYLSCGDGAATAIDPINHNNVYISCAGVTPGRGVIGRSSAGGAAGSFRIADAGISAIEGVPFPPYLTIDPTNPQNLYFTGNQHIYQTTDNAGNWTAISPDVTGGALWPCAIAVAPSDSNTVYSGSCDGAAHVSHNALSGTASTWQDISSGLPGQAITHITVDPSSPLKAYATISGFQAGHVFVTPDGGQSWTDIAGNLPDLPASDLVIDPELPGTLYVATDAGVFWTNTAGKVWSAIGSGLPQAAVLSLAFERTSRTLRAATHGRSVWDLQVPLQGLHLIPAISSVSPTQLPLNGANATLTVNGSNFTSASNVMINGTSHPTTFVSASQLTAVPATTELSQDELLTITVFTPGPGGGVSPSAYVKVGPNPAVFPNGFLNAASYLSGAAPGSITAVFGANLALDQALFQTVPLPTVLAGASLVASDPVTAFSGSAPVFYAAPGQMNVQIPWESVPFDDLSFTPFVGNTRGPAVEIAIQNFAPGIFTADQSGKGQGSITNALTGQLAAPSGMVANAEPVKHGDYISIYCTGLGWVDNPPPDGAPAPATSLVKTIVWPIVTIGAAPATVTFSGLAPGFIGLNQINAQIPKTAPTGDAVPLTISDGAGHISNTVTIAIQ